MHKVRAVWNLLIFRKQFDKEEDYDRAMQLMARDSIHSGIIAVRVLMAFELVMVLIWWASGNSFMNSYSVAYFLAYIALFLISFWGNIKFTRALRGEEDIVKTVVRGMYFYHVSLWLWSLFITFLDVSKSGEFSSILYMTIIVIIPLISFINPLLYMLLDVTGGAVIVLLLFLYCGIESNRGNLINFSVFVLISIVSGCAYFIVRANGYVNQVSLEKANEELKNSSEHDFLSGLYNRHKLGKIAEKIWRKCIKEDGVLSCLLCDLDDFKKFNDDYGHDMGDRCIRLVADIFRDNLKRSDAFAFRYGGEEFLILFPMREYDYVWKLAETLQKDLTHAVLAGLDEKHVVTMSIGIYTGKPSDTQRIEQYFSCADREMYRAKDSGKNCIKGTCDSIERNE